MAAPWKADSSQVTADSELFTADGGQYVPKLLPPVLAPTNLVLAAARTPSVTLTWTPPGSTFIVAYQIYRDRVLIATVQGALANTYVDTGVVNGKRYGYAVVAVNVAGDFSPSTPTQWIDLLQGNTLDWMISWVEQPGMAGRPDVTWGWR